MSDIPQSKPLLGLHTVKCLIIHKLTASNDGKHRTVVINRDNYPVETSIIKCSKANTFYQPEPQSAPPLPPVPPDNERITLELSLGNPINCGSRHSVYNVNVLNSSSIPYAVPPLVLKVSGEIEGRQLAQEAGMYEFLHSLQGVVIPRFYGWFSCSFDLLKGVVIPWYPKVKFPRDPETFDRFRMPNSRASLNVLLIEKVGEEVDDLPSECWDQFEQDLVDMNKDLAFLGVCYADWRLPNILYTPKVPPELEGMPSPSANRAYSYRIIDLEDAVRTNMTPRQINSETAIAIQMMVNHVKSYN